MQRVAVAALTSPAQWLPVTRPLTPEEVRRLEAGGNYCLPPPPPSPPSQQQQRQQRRRRPWECVRVLLHSAFDPSAVRNSTFGGTCVVLGAFGGARVVVVDGIHLPAGVYSSTLVDCMVCDGARVAQTTLLARAYVGRGATVQGCGTVCMTAAAAAAGGSAFANGSVLPIAVETGGRELAVFADMTLEEAARVVGDRRDAAAQAAWASRARGFAARVATHACTVVCDGAQLLNCPRVADAYVGAGTRVEASTLEDATVLSRPGAPTVVRGGCLVEHSIVQWGCRCESLAVVSGSFMCAASRVDRHAKLLHSVLGPCSSASEGEMSSSLVGPFVGFHHQALLIACFWPGGRGNVSHGANVGSNHTGKAPDQEIWPGEGTFFGLATAIKFPSDFSHAPYSLIATGVKTLPQRLEFPFSLVNDAGAGAPHGLSAAINEIMPGWVLSDNLYMVLRGESKFRARGNPFGAAAGGSGSGGGGGGTPLLCEYEYEALRADTVRLMLVARQRLEDAERLIDADGGGSGGGVQGQGQGHGQGARTPLPSSVPLLRDSRGEVVFTDRHVPGLGKNYLTARALRRGVVAYSDAVAFYATRALWRALQAGESPSAAATVAGAGAAVGTHTPAGAAAGGAGVDPAAPNSLPGTPAAAAAMVAAVGGGAREGGGKLSAPLDTTSTVLRGSRLSPTDEWYSFARDVAVGEMRRRERQRQPPSAPSVCRGGGDGGDGGGGTSGVCGGGGGGAGGQAAAAPPPMLDVGAALACLVQLQQQFADDVLRSKQKDDRRGPGIIADYAVAHAPGAEADAVVRRVRKEAEELAREVAAYCRQHGLSGGVAEGGACEAGRAKL